MPNNDGTGPNGQGPRTGRQLGKCGGRQPIERPHCGRRQRRHDGTCEGRGLGHGHGEGCGCKEE